MKTTSLQDTRVLPKYSWKIRSLDSLTTPDSAQEIASVTGCSASVAELLVVRGINTPDQAGEFLNPTEKQFLPPEAIPGLERAVDRIIDAVSNSESVLVHGDYDVDGISGAVILHQTLKDLGCRSGIFLPRRDDHGYGFSLKAVEKAKQENIDLIITVDCGISSLDNICSARDAGFDVILTDHHPVNDTPPDNVIVAHPELNGDYPGGKIAGATVAFKLMLAVLKKLEKDTSSFEEKYLPLIALATVADVCPLTKENRALVAIGLRGISESKLPGLRVLHDATTAGSTGNQTTARDLAFGIAPILNSAGRMGDPLPAAKLLLARDETTAWKLYRTLERLNRERKRIQNGIVARLLERTDIVWDTGGIIAVADEKCTPGLAGLAAVRIAEHTGRPVCVLAPSKDDEGPLYRGSMRTAGGENILELMQPVSVHTEKLGGHPGALGLSVRPDRIEKFLEACADISVESKPRELVVDLVISEPPSDHREVTDLDRTRPWGEGNPEPVVVWENVKIESARAVGREQNHLQVTLAGESGRTVKGIGFSMAGHVKGMDVSGSVFSLAGNLIINNWQGTSSVEFRIVDMKVT